MQKTPNIYPNNKGGYDIYLSPCGHIATVHSFGVNPNGILTQYKNVKGLHLQAYWNEWHAKLQKQLRQLGSE